MPLPLNSCTGGELQALRFVCVIARESNSSCGFAYQPVDRAQQISIILDIRCVSPQDPMLFLTDFDAQTTTAVAVCCAAAGAVVVAGGVLLIWLLLSKQCAHDLWLMGSVTLVLHSATIFGLLIIGRFTVQAAKNPLTFLFFLDHWRYERGITHTHKCPHAHAKRGGAIVSHSDTTHPAFREAGKPPLWGPVSVASSLSLSSDRLDWRAGPASHFFAPAFVTQPS
jgi:hypothetical protein